MIINKFQEDIVNNCVFCRIADGSTSTRFVYRDDDIVAFPDLHPKAPIHILIIPRKHIQSLNELEDNHFIANMIKVAKNVAKELGIFEKGYRLVVNTGPEGGQVIEHLHLHLLGGRHLKE